MEADDQHPVLKRIRNLRPSDIEKLRDVPKAVVSEAFIDYVRMFCDGRRPWAADEDEIIGVAAQLRMAGHDVNYDWGDWPKFNTMWDEDRAPFDRATLDRTS
jgi:hypothetical protein